MQAIDFSKATPELLNAFVKAQERGGTVGKDREAQGRAYVTGERMIKEAQACLDCLGIALVTSGWTAEAPTATIGDLGKGQYVSTRVRMSWALIGHGGVITGTCEMHAVASPSRPTEKAEASTLTYMMGYLVRGLFLLARGERDEYDVSRRDDEHEHEHVQARVEKASSPAAKAAAKSKAAPRATKPAARAQQQPPSGPPASKPPATAKASTKASTKAAGRSSLPPTGPDANAARKLAGDAGRAYERACKLRGFEPLRWGEVVLEATGRPWDQASPLSADEWNMVAETYTRRLTDVEDDGGGEDEGGGEARFDPHAPESAT